MTFIAGADPFRSRVDKPQTKRLNTEHGHERRNAIVENFIVTLWSGGVIPYELSSAFYGWYY